MYKWLKELMAIHTMHRVWNWQ